MTTPTTLAVVVPTRDRAGRLEPLVASLLADPATAEVVVVDDGSVDRTPAVLAGLAAADPRVRPVRGPGQGPLAARVTGVRAATCDVVLLLDDDVVPHPGLVSGHAGHHAGVCAPERRPGMVVLGWMPTTVAGAHGPDAFTTRLYAAEYAGRAQRYEQDPAVVLTHLWMGNLSLPREAFLAVTAPQAGPLPAFRHEDTEIGLRLAGLGLQPVFDRSLRADHHHARTLAQFRRDARLDGAGLAELDRHGREVLGPPGTQRFAAGLPGPLAALVRTCRRPSVAGPAAGALAGGVRVTGAARLWRVQLPLARVLRRVEQQRGYLDGP